jgi:hypothetical protein
MLIFNQYFTKVQRKRKKNDENEEKKKVVSPSGLPNKKFFISNNLYYTE